jgi:putative Holliday junction resolvase
MGRIVGIDFGTKRIGIAITDPLKIFASPLKTVKSMEFEEFMGEFMKTETVEGFVIGFPVQMNNKPSNSVQYLEPFIKKLKKLYPDKPIHLVDERFTSGIALNAIRDGGVKKRGRQDKSLVDKVSAAIILQSFLDQKKNKTGN